MTARILIVDDEPNIALSLEFLLQSNGYEVTTAHTGAHALLQATAFRPQLIVLDVMLPVIDGFEVCRRLRADPAQAGVKILLLTARGRAAEVQRGIDEGADAYMTKPFATRDLIEQVSRLLAGGA